MSRKNITRYPDTLKRLYVEVINSERTHLIFIELAVFVLLLALVLESDDNETDEDVHHEERDDDDIDDVVCGHDRPKVVNWSMILFIGIDRPI